MSQPVEVSMRANLPSSVISKKTKAIGTTRSTASYGEIRLDSPESAVPFAAEIWNAVAHRF